MKAPPQQTRSAFTLIELLVVIAVISVFVGVFATALRPGSPTVAVEGAQSQIASLLTQARGVAILRNSNVRLIVHNDISNPDRYLRFFGIVYGPFEYDDNNDGTPDRTEWEPATDGITLPSSVYAYIDDPANMDTSPFSIPYISNENERYAFIQFNSNGTVRQVGNASPILAVSYGEPEVSSSGDLTGVFRNDETRRGAIVRQYGSFVLLNEPAAFPNN
ncbi:MAG: prepilin-type N-terminal cleavage/methylation domain-containing protein [Verrucomicrobiota bacterium]